MNQIKTNIENVTILITQIYKTIIYNKLYNIRNNYMKKYIRINHMNNFRICIFVIIFNIRVSWYK